MKLLVTGAHGQLGWELVRSLQAVGDVVAVDRRTADLADPIHLARTIQAARPDVIVNAAAYTAVDRAEEQQSLAMLINGTALAVLGDEARACGALLVHYSTDYVFDGTKGSPYQESDAPSPLNSYGASKLAGERALSDSGCDWLVLRTTWVYAARGQNFVRTMLRLAGERETLRIVADQHGAPTSARLLADATSHLVRQAMHERALGSFTSGIFHCSSSGDTSWYEFATAIIDGMRDRIGSERVKTSTIEPITTADYPLPAQRPLNSMLDNALLHRRFGLELPHWRIPLNLVLDEIFGPLH